ncbi:unnamed protein product [Polarella glacialis]|uniref:Uncharacterized protein n=1 Tax=Polarella glacialis TaxID=89957 RepID=A0A813H2B8_POLGL|nr:unnamed protein product [Polarella glacialis]
MRAAEMDLPHTRRLNHIPGYVSETREKAQLQAAQEALRKLGANSDLLNIDSYLIERPYAVNMPVQFDQGSLLHIASVRGHSELAQMLIHRRGAAIDATNHSQQTSLHAACEANHGAIVVELLCAGADADKRDNLKETPLHRAAHCGSSDALLALLDYGANTRLRDEGGLMAIHKAALMGREEAVRLLAFEAEAVNVEAADGWMPLHFAAHGGHAAAVETLIMHGADVHAVDAERMTPLHRAATSGSELACQALPGRRRPRGARPLQEVASSRRLRGGLRSGSTLPAGGGHAGRRRRWASADGSADCSLCGRRRTLRGAA